MKWRSQDSGLWFRFFYAISHLPTLGGSKPETRFRLIVKGNNMARLFEDITRWQHFYIGALMALLATILCTLGAMVAAEYKDKVHGGKWDWKDLACGLIGGLLGQGVQIGIILILL